MSKVCYDEYGKASYGGYAGFDCPLPVDAKRKAPIQWATSNGLLPVECATNQEEAETVLKNLETQFFWVSVPAMEVQACIDDRVARNKQYLRYPEKLKELKEWCKL